MFIPKLFVMLAGAGIAAGHAARDDAWAQGGGLEAPHAARARCPHLPHRHLQGVSRTLVLKTP